MIYLHQSGRLEHEHMKKLDQLKHQRFSAKSSRETEGRCDKITFIERKVKLAILNYFTPAS